MLPLQLTKNQSHEPACVPVFIQLAFQYLLLRYELVRLQMEDDGGEWPRYLNGLLYTEQRNRRILQASSPAAAASVTAHAPHSKWDLEHVQFVAPGFALSQ